MKNRAFHLFLRIVLMGFSAVLVLWILYQLLTNPMAQFLVWFILLVIFALATGYTMKNASMRSEFKLSGLDAESSGIVVGFVFGVIAFAACLAALIAFFPF